VHTLGLRIGGQSRDGIWLLDDDVSMLKALGRLMNSAGFIVERFNDPATFLAKLQDGGGAKTKSLPLPPG
jgi:FixJ family two-component response regulator